LKKVSLNTEIETFVAKPETKGRFFYTPDLLGFNFERRASNIAELLDQLRRESSFPEADIRYAGGVNIPEHLPAFQEDHAPPFIDPESEHLASIWIGGRTRIVPHWDLPQNLACLVAGKRRFTLFPPDQLPNLYFGPIDRTIAGQPCSLVDIAAPDLQKFPRFAEASKHAQVAELDPGDVLYLPSLWIHAVDSLDAFGVLVNYWWRDGPAHLVTPSYTLLHALLTLDGMPLSERQRWRGLFDHYIFSRTDETLAHIPEAARGVLGEKSPDALKRLRHYLGSKLMR
jgi:hypothetical protein